MDTDHGLFLSFDGVPHSGRTTFANQLAATLSADGHDVVRVSLPHGDTPLAKTSAAWLDDVLDRVYPEIVAREVVPALQRGAVVIADQWVTGALVRAQAAGGLSTGEALFREERALRLAPVDVEWVFLDPMPEQRALPGFRAAAKAREDSRCSTRNRGFVVVPSLGARRRTLYLVTNAHAARMPEAFAYQVNEVLTERRVDKDGAWSAVVAETQEARDLARALAYAPMWPEVRPAVIATLATWHLVSDEARVALIDAIPVPWTLSGHLPIAAMLLADLARIPAGEPAVDEAVARKREAVEACVAAVKRRVEEEAAERARRAAEEAAPAVEPEAVPA